MIAASEEVGAASSTAAGAGVVVVGVVVVLVALVVLVVVVVVVVAGTATATASVFGFAGTKENTAKGSAQSHGSCGVSSGLRGAFLLLWRPARELVCVSVDPGVPGTLRGVLGDELASSSSSSCIRRPVLVQCFGVAGPLLLGVGLAGFMRTYSVRPVEWWWVVGWWVAGKVEWVYPCGLQKVFAGLSCSRLAVLCVGPKVMCGHTSDFVA